MNDSATFIWLKSIKTRLERHGAASVDMVVSAENPVWHVNATVSPPMGMSVNHHFEAGSILELMDAGNKWVDGFDMAAEQAKRWGQQGDVGQYVTSTQPVFATGYSGGGAATSVGGLFGGGGAGNYTNAGIGQQYGSATNIALQTSSSAQYTAQAQVNAIRQQQLQHAGLQNISRAVIVVGGGGAGTTKGNAALPTKVATIDPLQASIDAAYAKMLGETVTTPSLGKRILGVFKK